MQIAADPSSICNHLSVVVLFGQNGGIFGQMTGPSSMIQKKHLSHKHVYLFVNPILTRVFDL